MLKTVSIEITNNCNNQCLICPHGHNLIRDKGYMDSSLFRKIIKYFEAYKNIIIELHGIGEPLLHPLLPDFISYCTQKGLFTSICTNAILLNAKMSEKLFKSGIKKIVVSLETKENYERIRCINIYDKVLENVISIVDTYPSIEVEVFMISLEGDDPLEFNKFAKQFGNRKITFNSFCASDWCGKIPFEGLVKKNGVHVKKIICPLFQSYCSIDFNGNVRHCYLDFNSEKTYGDLNDGDFESIWNSQNRLSVMDKMKNGLYEDLYPCRDCVFPFSTNLDDKNFFYDNDFNRPEMQLLSKIKSKEGI